MKISSVSKKVLASALSAAMVVAFAPTVAFGKAGDAVNITIDANGGAVTQSTYTGFKEGDKITLPTATDPSGYAFAKWTVSIDGAAAADVSDVDSTTPGIQYSFVADAGTDYVFKANYTKPALSSVFTAPGSGITGQIAFTIANASTAKAGHDYKLSVTNEAGTEIAFANYKAPDKDTAATIASSETLKFKENVLSDDSDNTETKTMAVVDTLLGSGAYTATLTDNGAVVSTNVVKLVKLTMVHATPSSGDKPADSVYYAPAGADGIADFTSFVSSADSALKWIDANGYSVSSFASVKTDTVLTETAVTASVASAGYDAGEQTITFTVSDAGAKDGDTYAVSVVDPSGAEVYAATFTSTANGKVDGDNTSGTAVFTFKANSAKYIQAKGGATEKAGNYVATVTRTAKADGKTSVAKGKLALSQVVVSAGEGSYKTDKSTTEAIKGKTSLFTSGSTYTVPASFSTYLTAPEGKQFSKWVLGKQKKSDNEAVNLTAGEVNTITATYVAKAAQVAKPTFTVAEKTENKVDYYYITPACATPTAQIQVKESGSFVALSAATGYDAATKSIKVAKNSAASTYVFKALYAAGQTDPAYKDLQASDELTITKNVKGNAWKTATQGASVATTLESYVGQTKVKWLAQDTIAAAIAAGKAQIDGLGIYYTDTTAADAAELAAYKALYEAVSAFATATLAPYAEENAVVVGNKALVITRADLKTATDAIAKDNKDVADAEKAETISIATYNGKLADVIAKANTALNGAKESKTVTAADITAAQAVTAQLQAATTGEAAEAALKAYAALTDAQKKLVATADVAKAEAVAAEAKAAAELKVAQDDAAVSKARSASKTVKAGANGKTTKKQSVTLKSITSASGAKVTYKKSSGSSKVSVKSGKAYLAKGVKKGTYKATVKATCGTQTAKIKVTFKVK